MVTARPDGGFGNKRGSHGDDLARRLPGAAAGGRPVGVERLDLVADPLRLGEAVGAADDPKAHFIGLAVPRARLAMQSVDTDQVEAHLRRPHAGQSEPFAHDVERKSSHAPPRPGPA